MTNSTKLNTTNRIHMSEITMSKRVIAYITILVGYFFYCYNFSVIDYVRPFLVENYGMTMQQTALFYTAQSLGALIGAFTCAWFAENIGRKKTLIAITLINGICTIINMKFQSFEIWMAMRFIIGISLGGYYTVAVSTMVGLFQPKVRGKVVAIASILFPIATIVMANLGGILGTDGWETLMWIGGIPPIIAAIVMLFFVADDKKVIPYGSSDKVEKGTKTEVKKGTWGEMFSKKYVRFTICCILLSGLNFMGFQFFNGFVTVYLKEVRMFDLATMGILISASSSGQLIGGYIWGVLADKFGRKINALGFILSSVMLCLYFVAPTNVVLLSVLGFLYGVGLNSASIWGGYFTEIFPEHLRSMGASLFHGGRIISLFAPSIVVFVGEIASLQVAMWGAPIIFTAAALIWFTLPETLKTGKMYKGYDANSEEQIA
ncbi:MAG: MFS transporter [Terrisporobacter sp.]|uniref:MFS transporter n=1 Tax=Terrisporobacter sp. TaxID=1965305 RepID=UPI002FC98F39